MTKIALSEIKIGTRHRKDMGDLQSLADSMTEIGLLHPIVINKQNKLIAGRRRIEAAKLLDWKDIPATVIDLDKVILGERAENEIRKDFTPSEWVAIRRETEPTEIERAKKRHGRPKNSEKFAGFSDSGNALDKVAHAIGTSRTSLEKATAVVDAAEREPQKYNMLVEEMDRTGKVDKAYRLLKSEEKRKDFSEREFPVGKFGVIYADPPWEYEFSQSGSRTIENHYPSMPLEEICNLPTMALADDNCILFLWATSPKLKQALSVMDAWGFEYKTNMVWIKERIGMGYYARQQHELLLIGTRGKPPTPPPEQRPSSIISSPRTEHSEKPEETYAIIESMYPKVPRIELFARKNREGWLSWGNQV